jgi:hypothetical protein
VSTDESGERYRWLQHLSEAERAQFLSLDEAVEMHRKLMRPLQAARRRVLNRGLTRMLRAGARSDAA